MPRKLLSVSPLTLKSLNNTDPSLINSSEGLIGLFLWHCCSGNSSISDFVHTGGRCAHWIRLCPQVHSTLCWSSYFSCSLSRHSWPDSIHERSWSLTCCFTHSVQRSKEHEQIKQETTCKGNMCTLSRVHEENGLRHKNWEQMKRRCCCVHPSVCERPIHPPLTRMNSERCADRLWWWAEDQNQTPSSVTLPEILDPKIKSTNAKFNNCRLQSKLAINYDSSGKLPEGVYLPDTTPCVTASS